MIILWCSLVVHWPIRQPLRILRDFGSGASILGAALANKYKYLLIVSFVCLLERVPIPDFGLLWVWHPAVFSESLRRSLSPPSPFPRPRFVLSCPALSLFVLLGLPLVCLIRPRRPCPSSPCPRLSLSVSIIRPWF